MTIEEMMAKLNKASSDASEDGSYYLEGLIGEAADRIEALERQVKAADALAEKLEGWIGVAATCAIESGVCRCGDNMERHGNPLDCGHSPVDHGAYVATQLIDDTTSALAAYTATKEGGA